MQTNCHIGFINQHIFSFWLKLVYIITKNWVEQSLYVERRHLRRRKKKRLRSPANIKPGRMNMESFNKKFALYAARANFHNTTRLDTRQPLSAKTKYMVYFEG